jgi:hypothetical protein
MRTTDKVTALVRFKDAALRYGTAIESGNKSAATKAAREGRSARDILLANGRDKVDFFELLDNHDPWIRYAAAASLLEDHSERALQVLTELQQFQGSIGALAFTAVKMSETKKSSN